MIAQFASGVVVLILIFGAFAVDGFAEWNRNRRTSRRGAVSVSPPAPVRPSRPSTGGPAQTTRRLHADAVGVRSRRPEADPGHPSLSRWW